MSNRTLTIVVVLIFIAAAIGLFFYYESRVSSLSQSTDATKGGFGFGTFFPFGQTDTPSSPQGNGSVSTPTPSGSASPLKHLVVEPIAGFMSFEQNGVAMVRYAERATAHTQDIDLTGTREPLRVSNTTIPKIYRASWLGSSTTVALQYLDTSTENIVTYLAKILPGNGSGAGRLQGSFLPQNTLAVVASPTNTKMAYLFPDGNGVHLMSAAVDGTKAVEIFSSPLNEWLLSWPATDTIALATRPSATVAGALYFLNVNVRTLTSVLGDIPGLTALPSPKLTKVLVSQGGSEHLLTIFDVKKKTNIAVPLWTLAEKCVWSRSRDSVLWCATPFDIEDSSLPDSWYQGVTSFADNIVEINAETGKVTLIEALIGETGESLDAMGLMPTPDEKQLLFINKNDSTLWSLRLTTDPSTLLRTGNQQSATSTP